ncbi:MAG: hypothetical protein ACOCTT_01165 [archaeon]
MAEWGEYDYREEGWKKYLEGIIPLIILILIGIVIASKMGWISGIPFLGNLFDQGPVRVAVLGDLRAENANEPAKIDAPYLAAYFDADHRYEVTTWSDLEVLEFAGEDVLDDFDLVILAGERQFSPRVKGEIGRYIRGGGKVILIGDAAIQDSEYPEVIGWEVGDLAGAFPIRISPNVKRSDIENPERITSTPEKNLTFSFITTDHDIVERAGVGYSVDLQEIEDTREECIAGINSLPVTMGTGGGDIISVISGISEETNQTKTIIGIAERKGAFGRGHVMYFPYDPGCLPTIFDEAAGHMLGRTIQ